MGGGCGRKAGGGRTSSRSGTSLPTGDAAGRYSRLPLHYLRQWEGWSRLRGEVVGGGGVSEGELRGAGKGRRAEGGGRRKLG